jgi:putative ABC transport system permease protein
VDKPDSDEHAGHDHGAEAHAGHDHGEVDKPDSDEHAGHDHGAEAHAGHDHGEVDKPDSDEHAGHDHGAEAHAGHDHGNAHKHDPAPKKSKILPPISKEGKEVTAYLVQYKKDGEGNTSMRAVVEAAQIIEDNSENLGCAKPAIQLQRLLEMTGLGMGFLSALAFIIIIISAFSMFISLYSSLKERRYEMALMRVMGATPSKLFIMIILEGILVAAAGLILGLLISHIGVEIMAADLEETYKYNFSGFIFLIEELYLVLGALFIGFLAAVIPAMQAYEADISETLSNS